jgi:serine protease AprX
MTRELAAPGRIEIGAWGWSVNTVVFGLTWSDRRKQLRERMLVIVVAAVLAALPAMQVAAAGARFVGHAISVILRADSPQDTRAAAGDVVTAGGHVVRTLGIINGVEATVPADSTGWLRSRPGVVSVSDNSSLHMFSTTWDPTTDLGSAFSTTKLTGAQTLWANGYTGRGVDVALIDSGVVGVNGLTAPGKVINGPDLSFESQVPGLQYMDTYGHGTHMAGIIAGRDDAATSYVGDSSDFVGMAPDSRIVSIKVADSRGSTDISQVIAAIDWVVQHKNDNGMNIRVLNLSFGTDSSQSYTLDPLAYAAEVAWRNGIVVVAAVGNAGFAPAGSVADPAIDPYVIAVGAADPQGTLATSDDTVASFSQNGVTRKPDLVAPGVHIASLRNPNSYIDQAFGSTATVATRFFRGSGTSQAAAVVSGAAALLLSQRPWLSNDQVKALLTSTATSLDSQSVNYQGKGEVNLAATLTAVPANGTQTFNKSTGTGQPELVRGSVAVSMNGVVLQGEQGIMGQRFDDAAMASLEAAGQSWSGGVWNGQSWSGQSWSGQSWSGQSWSGQSWSGQSWSGQSWSSQTWSGQSWSGQSWSGQSWSGQSWSGQTWSSVVWSGQTWSSQTWSGQSWSSQTWSDAGWSDYDWS